MIKVFHNIIRTTLGFEMGFDGIAIVFINLGGNEQFSHEKIPYKLR
jgi:hypothetical protein